MKPIIKWIVGMAAGLLAGTNTIRMLKVVNEDNENYGGHPMVSSSIQSESQLTDQLPYIMGSEHISAALQGILSSEEQSFAIRSGIVNEQKDCELGSESLNRLLGEMMTSSSTNENAKLIHFDPAIRL